MRHQGSQLRLRSPIAHLAGTRAQPSACESRRVRVRFLCSNLLSTPFKMHYTKHHYFSTTFLLLHLLHCGCSITKMEGHVGLHTPMQRQLRAYPYAYTLLPLYYISTSLSHWLSWPLGSNRLWASVARTFKVGDWESSWLFWTLPDHPHARIQLFRRLDGADRI